MESISGYWGKTRKHDDSALAWHPLVLHMLDVAACADAIVSREPVATHARLAAILGMTWESAWPWLLLVIACHDLGKACPGFQCKWENLSGLNTGRSPNTDINHAFVSQIALAGLLADEGWPDDLAELVADAVGCHHGERASPNTLYHLENDERALGKNEWTEARWHIWKAARDVFRPGSPPSKGKLSGPDFMLLAGLASFADWLGSNETWFSFGTPEDCRDLRAWLQSRRHRADQALDAIGWEPRLPLATVPRTFEEVFGFAPRSLQQAVAAALDNLQTPAILLVEAPMGEGKTEAAFHAHVELQRRFGHRGLYVALPTKATGNAMFDRTLKFLRGQQCDRTLDLQLLHGGALLNESFQKLKLGGIYDDAKSTGEVRAGEWFTHKKRALLSEYGVGTIDQALLTILPVRHQFVRLWGLANRVVVFDEIHAYDAYTGTLLIYLLRWLLALGSSVILLSATLPPSIRRELAKATGAAMPEQEAEYPRLSVYAPGRSIRQYAFAADPARSLRVAVQPIPAELSAMRDALDSRLLDGGYALALVNTVQRAQELYRLYPDGEPLMIEGRPVGKRLADGSEIYLFHARFPADRRQQREDAVLDTFGAMGERAGRKILIATQVAEQSLDLDFDLIATDLAPIDLLLQRAGRLWRHARPCRPLAAPTLLVAGLDQASPPSFDKPLWWSKVYREDVLLRTWCLLHEKTEISLPGEIDTLVRRVYEKEEQVEVPESLQQRLDKSLQEGEGKAYAHTGQAHQSIIGSPDDASWNDTARFVLYDDDEPGVHRDLRAKTRIGDDSVIAIPLWEADTFKVETQPDFGQARNWFLRAMSLSRKGIVSRLRKAGVPEGWKKSPLLRNAYPLRLDVDSCWIEDDSVRLDDALGLVYESKGDE